MKPVAAVVTWSGRAEESRTLESLGQCEMVGETAVALAPGAAAPEGEYAVIRVPSLWATSSVVDILRWFEMTHAEHLLWIFPGSPILSGWGLKRLWSAARDTDAGIAYGDYCDVHADGAVTYHPLVDYQPGSLGDDFDFGPVVLLSRAHLSGLAEVLEKEMPGLQYGGWYELRLRLAEWGSVLRVSEPIYQVPRLAERPSGQKVFDYVDPSRRHVELEMEQVVTGHLRRIRAWLEPPTAKPLEDEHRYPFAASVVIPVKNRARTIADAVGSALSQETRFDFNVIVVDNHSTDGTTWILEDIGRKDRRLVHIVPERWDLQIGACWNEAVFSEPCGRIAVQLDSDDLYDGTGVLERIVLEFDRKPYALVIGSYTTVDLNLEPIPPGLVDHREWTDTNGHNNALRIAGLGAPRAYHVPTLRTIGFPNVSYGEDYAVVLRLSGIFPVGRIFDSLYWCRRWEGNSDSRLTLETSNRYAAYKDLIRTIEIAARQRRSQAPR